MSQSSRAAVLRFVCLLMLSCSIVIAQSSEGAIQDASPGLSSAGVPRVVKFSGVLKDVEGKAIVGKTRVTFAIHSEQLGGEQLWQESREVLADEQGRYTVLLGSTKNDGLEPSVFADGTARWLSVQVEGQTESARVLLVSTPYALKAADADTVSGFKPGDFILTKAARERLATASGSSQQALEETFGAVSSTSNTTNFIAKFTSTDTIGDSILFDNGSGVGFGTTTPGSKMHLKGTGHMMRLDPDTASQNLVEFYRNGSPKWLWYMTSTDDFRFWDTTDRVTFRAGGNVGIGTTTPASKLHLKGPGQMLRIDPDSTSQNIVEFYVNGLPKWLWYLNGNDFRLWDTTDRVTFQSGGNVGFGTTSPGSKLHLKGAGQMLRIDPDSTSQNIVEFYVNGQPKWLWYLSGNDFRLWDTADRVTFQAGGNVGIGTTSPASRLDVVGSSSTQVAAATQTAAGVGSFTVGAPPPAAIRGDATAASNYVLGVLGTVSSPSGAGVVGMNLAASGNNAGAGVRGITTSSSAGTGVWGEATATTGDNVGVYGTSASSVGTGVIGEATSTTSGDSAGVYGLARSNGGIGIFGESVFTGAGASSTLFPIGVWGRIQSTSGAAAVFDTFNTSTNLILGRSGSLTAPANVFRVSGTGAVFANGGVNTSGADFAESVSVVNDKSDYQPGDVIAIDTNGTRRFTKVGKAYSTLVAGIYSTKPGILASPHQIDDSRVASEEIPLAVVGIVPCKVTNENGAIKAGDLLVSSSREGYAMKGTDSKRMNGAVIGKALQDMKGSTGVIEVLVSLQ